MEAIKLYAHAIKGAGRNVGAKRIYDIAGRMESAGKKIDMDAAAQLFDKLKSEFEKLASFLSGANWIEIAKQDKVITTERLKAYQTSGA